MQGDLVIANRKCGVGQWQTKAQFSVLRSYLFILRSLGACNNLSWYAFHIKWHP